MSVQELNALVGRLEAVASRLEGAAGAPAPASQAVSAAPSAGESSASVAAFDELMQGSLARYLALSKEIGSDVATQAAEVEAGYKAQRAFLVMAASSKQPQQEVLAKLLEPMSSKMQAVQTISEKSKSRDQVNHLKTLQESIPALGWVAVSPTPGPFVKDMLEAGQFWANRVLKDLKDQATHKNWCQAWKDMWTELLAYIKQHHTTGVSWNPRGGEATSPAAAVSAPPPPAGGPPPPPPPPPPPSADDASGESDGKLDLFADLNRGFDVTTGLKKVTDDMKTHKNPALRSGPAPFKKATDKPKPAPKPSAKPVAKAAAAPQKPPNTELQGKRWMVEYHKDNSSIVIDETENKQTVYVFKCERSTVQVKGKINSIILDNCKKVAIVFDDVISGLEFVNCQSVKAQVLGKCPNVTIDKTDGCMVYLSKDAIEAEIVTAKSSEMNVLFPKDDGEYSEHPVPEQFKSKFNSSKGTLETTITEVAA